MKKLTTIFLSLIIASVSVFSQPVSDNAIIPVAVTLNSILRLNVVSGGNIEFAVNTLDQYTDGIENSTRYDTKFTVASSIDFDVVLYAEDATLMGSDATGTNANSMPLWNIGYEVEETGGGVIGTNWNIQGGTGQILTVVTNSSVDIVTSLANAGAGDVAENAFTVHWELCTSSVVALIATSYNTLLYQSLSADRYATNIFIALEPH